MVSRSIFACVALALLLIWSRASAGDDAMTALASTSGTWEGELFYLDYQSGRRFGIPMRIDAEVTPDNATLLRRITYTDPGNKVYAVNLVTIDSETGELVEAYFRDGGAEQLRYDVTKYVLNSPTHWEVTYEHDGTDDGRPARIRHRLTRDGNRLTSEKAVRFADDSESTYFLRNGTDLTLVTP